MATEVGQIAALGLDRNLPVDPRLYTHRAVHDRHAIPAFVYSLKEVLATRKQPASGS